MISANPFGILKSVCLSNRGVLVDKQRDATILASVAIELVLFQGRQQEKILLATSRVNGSLFGRCLN